MMGWGGKREGAGRPLIGGIPRKPRQARLTDEEWGLVKDFIQLVKQDIGKAKKLMEQSMRELERMKTTK